MNMGKNMDQNQELIVSALHDRQDARTDIPQALKETSEFKVSEKIYAARDKVTLLNSISTEDQFWNKLRSRIRPRSVYVQWMKYAAIVILSLSVGIVITYFSGIIKPVGQLASISSPRGQITSLTLFDGTIVWLNSETTLQYSSDFNKNKREVYVSGEAYFEVAHNDKLPFIVDIGNSKVKVYGTTFDVKAYPEDDFTETVLVEGKVEFITKDKSVFLNPSEKIIFSTAKGTLHKEYADAEIASAWKKGKYYYNNEKLSSIIQQLQRWYDTEFIFNEEELTGLTFTGVVNREKSVGYNLKIIELTNKIKFEVKNDAIVISRK